MDAADATLPDRAARAARWSRTAVLAPVVLPVLAGLTLAAALPPVGWSNVAWVALVPLGLAVADNRHSGARYLGAYLGGVAYHLIGLDWMRTCHGSHGLDGTYALPWLIAGQVGALGFVAVFAAARWLRRNSTAPLSVLLPVAWLSFEWLRHHGAAIVDQTGFPWLKLSLALADDDRFRQVADLGGEYAVALLPAVAAGVLADVWLGWQRATSSGAAFRSVALATVLIGSAAYYGEYRLRQQPAARGPVVCLMSEEDLPPLVSTARLRLAGERPDLLVWSELAFHHPVWSDGQGNEPRRSGGLRAGNVAIEHLRRTARQFGAALVIGCEHWGGGHCRNAVACVDAEGEYQGCYDKVNLVPWSEFLPPAGTWLPHGECRFQRGEAARVFPLRTPAGTVRVGAAICYDSAFAAHFRRLMQSPEGPPDLLVDCGSEGQDGSGALARGLAAMARLRAVETRRPIVRNIADGESGVLDACGRWVAKAPGTIVAEPLSIGAAPLDARQSLYARVGDWPLSALAVVWVGAAVGSLRGRERRRRFFLPLLASPARTA